MLSRLKLDVLWILRSDGDFRIELPLGMGAREDGISIVKFSRAGSGNCLTVVPEGRGGESPVEEGDILCACVRVCVSDVMAVVCSQREQQTRRSSA
jgi:hypothetical protein